MRRALIVAIVMALSAVASAQHPALDHRPVTEQTGCMPVYIPPGLETGDFATGIWTSTGSVFIGGTEHRDVYVWIQDNGDMAPAGKAGHTFKGTETATYDFGAGDTFTTLVSYVTLHQADMAKWSMNATERIVAGTGRFANASGMMTDTGYYGLDHPDDPNSTTGWAYFTIRGAICGVEK